MGTTICWLQYYGYHMKTSSNRSIFRVTGLLCGEFTGPGEFPTQRPVARSFDVFFDLRLNKRLSKQPWGWWCETPSRPLWRQCNELINWQFVNVSGTMRTPISLFYCVINIWYVDNDKNLHEWSTSAKRLILMGISSRRRLLVTVRGDTVSFQGTDIS